MSNEPTPQAPADEREALQELLCGFRLSNFVDDLGDAGRLVDRLSVGPDISDGQAQIEMLADDIACFYADRASTGSTSQAPAPADERSEFERWAFEPDEPNMVQAPAADERDLFEAWAVKDAHAYRSEHAGLIWPDGGECEAWSAWQARASRSGTVHAALNADQGHPAVQPVEPAACSTADQRSLSAVDAWQPIETAPKDGTRILLGYFPETGGSGCEVAWWHSTHTKWCGRVLLNADGHFSPTHWMPLPPAPGASPLPADQGHPAVPHVEPAAFSTADQRSLSEVESLRDCLDSWHDVTAERRRQMEVEGWTPEHDDEHRRGEMASAAAAYAAQAGAMMRLGTSFYDSDPPPSIEWPWARGWWKPGPPRRMLVKAGALILAEIERLDRAATEGAPQ